MFRRTGMVVGLFLDLYAPEKKFYGTSMDIHSLQTWFLTRKHTHLLWIPFSDVPTVNLVTPVKSGVQPGVEGSSAVTQKKTLEGEFEDFEDFEDDEFDDDDFPDDEGEWRLYANQTFAHLNRTSSKSYVSVRWWWMNGPVFGWSLQLEFKN